MKCIECFSRLANKIRNYVDKKCWLLLSLFVITALASIIVPICSHHIDKDNIITKRENLSNWETVYEGEKEVLFAENLAKLEDVSIKHYPPRLVGWDANVIITVETSATTGTFAYVYIREKNEKSGLRYLVNTKGKTKFAFQIDMSSDNLTKTGSDNLTKIQNAELYILDADGEKVTHEFEVLRGGDFTPTIGIFVTMIAITVALLSLWAQQTPSSGGEKSKGLKKSAVTLKRFWSYMAVFIALLSLIAFLSQFSPNIKVTPYILPLYFVGLALLISSITMVVLNVFESIVSVIVSIFIKGVDNHCIDFESYYKCAFAVLIFFALSLCISLICLIANGLSWWQGWLFIPFAACLAIIVHTCKIKRYDNN